MRLSIGTRHLAGAALQLSIGWSLVAIHGAAQEVEVGVEVEGPEVEVATFRPALSPYGEWVEVPGYGLVWRPYRRVVGVDFVPYGSSGHWVYTDAGWVWASDYDWGWATFHYGNWVYVDEGWDWIPGPVWAPAWVEWRYGGGYIGWAPLAPVGVVAVVAVQPRYVFVQENNFTASNLRGHAIVGAQAQAIVHQTSPLPSVQVANGHPVAAARAGPRPEMVAKATGHPVAPVPVHSLAAAIPPRSASGVHYPTGASAAHPIAVRAPGAGSPSPAKGSPEPSRAAPAMQSGPPSKPPQSAPAHSGSGLGRGPASPTTAPATPRHTQRFTGSQSSSTRANPPRHRDTRQAAAPSPAHPASAPPSIQPRPGPASTPMEHAGPPQRPPEFNQAPPMERPPMMPAPTARPAPRRQMR
jgi:hypothetical protein